MMIRKELHTLLKRPRLQQSGNIFFMLFASVALVGAFGIGASNTMKGIVTSMSDVTRKTIAEERMASAARLAVQNPASTGPLYGDCDTDAAYPLGNGLALNFIEPLPTRDPAGKPAPAGGGLVPENIGAAVRDPWGTEYGYCAWNPGTGTCTDSARRLAGANDPTKTVVAVISAGKDRKFSTTCNPIAGGGGADCTGLGPEFYNDPVSGHCYYRSSDQRDHAGATAACAANGAYLATITSPAESAIFDTRFLAAFDTAYVGMGDPAHTATWVYTGGENSGTQFWQGLSPGTQVGGNFANWYAGEPNNDLANEYCVGIDLYNRGNNWTDMPCDWVRDYVCEKSPPAGGAVTKAAGSDDLVMEYSYDDLRGLGGDDLWKVRDTKPDTATIDKNIEVGGGGSFSGAINLLKQGLILPTQADAAFATCTAGLAEQLRLNTSTSPVSLEICHSGAWVPISMGAAAPSGDYETKCAGATTPGTMCTDGNVFLYEDTSGFYYTTKCDVGQTWDGSTCTGTRIAVAWNHGNNTGGVFVGATSPDQGEENTAKIVIADSDSLTAGIQLHELAQACSDLSINGKTDWYLPAINELTDYIYANRAAIGGFSSAQSIYYPSSTETHSASEPLNYAQHSFTTNYTYTDGDAKQDDRNVRCIRKGSRQPGSMPTGAILYLNFNESSGTLAADGTGSNDATLAGGATFVPGKNGRALSVNDADGRAVVANESAFDFDVTQDWTVSGWFYRNAGANEDDLFGKTDPNLGYRGFQAFADGGSINFQAVGASGSVTRQLPDTGVGRWTHYTVVYNFSLGSTAANLHVYVDGIEDPGSVTGTGPLTSDTILNNVPLTVGNYETGSNYSMNGNVDDFVVFNRALTAAEAYTLYARTKDGEAVTGGGSAGGTGFTPPTGLLGWWKFDETSGTTAADSGGNNITGTLAGNAAFVPGKFGNAIALDGVNDWVDMGSPAVLDDTILSACAWINFSSGAQPEIYSGIVDKSNNSNAGFQMYTGQSDPAEIGVFLDGATKQDKALSTASGWKHVCGTFPAATFTGASAKVYVNGALSTQSITTSNGSSASDAARKLLIGSSNDGVLFDFKGQIDDVMVFNRELTAAEVTSVYLRGAAPGTMPLTYNAPNPSVVLAADRFSGKMALGDDLTCLIKPDNGLWCGGKDSMGQLGNGAAITADQQVLTRVTDYAPFMSVTAGNEMACGLKADGSAWCWGNAAVGRLGNGTTTPNQPAPVAVSGGHIWSQLSSAQNHTCGIRIDGTAYCWGNDSSGQLGNAGGGNSTTPGAVSDVGPWVKISSGYMATCGIKGDGSLWCWGDDSEGQLGNDTSKVNSQSPVPVVEPGPWVDVAAGYYHVCAIKQEGTLWCWGDNTYGKLGINSTTDATLPQKISDPGPWLSLGIYATAQGSCAIKMDGTAWCWGRDTSKQVGNGLPAANVSVPSRVTDPGPWGAIMTSSDYSCGIKTDGSAWCWGSDDNGRSLNGPSYNNETFPTRVLNYPTGATFTWNDAGTMLTASGTASIGLGGNSALSFDGDVSGGLPNGLRFDTGGQMVLRQAAGAVTTDPGIPDLVGYWPFDETSGTTANDSLGENPGTVMGSATFGTGISGNALLLDGVDDYVNVPASHTFANLNAWTACAWVNFLDAPGGSKAGIIDKTTDGAAGWNLYFDDSNTTAPLWGLNVNSGANSELPTYSTYGQWHHVCGGWSPPTAEYPNGSREMWIDGVSVISSTSGVSTNDDSALSLKFGAYASTATGFFRGKLDEIMVFKRKLNTQDVRNIMNYTKVVGGSKLLVETQATTTSSQISWKAATASTTRSLGIDYNTKSLELVNNTTNVDSWLHSLPARFEIDQYGSVGVGTTGTASAKLHIVGGLRLGNDTGPCNPLRAGTMRYVGGSPAYQYCDGSGWVNF